MQCIYLGLLVALSEVYGFNSLQLSLSGCYT